MNKWIKSKVKHRERENKLKGKLPCMNNTYVNLSSGAINQKFAVKIIQHYFFKPCCALSISTSSRAVYSVAGPTNVGPKMKINFP